uniref:Uncharacterized protein n=1 Tax=Arundo donax TaxID=35708 RepID=A0A0A9F5Y1_ARUDO
MLLIVSLIYNTICLCIVRWYAYRFVLSCAPVILFIWGN